MSTAAIAGFGGQVTGTGATEVKEWTITLTNDAPEATSFSATGWKEFIPCLQSGSGSFKSNDPGTVGVHNSASFRAGASGLTISGKIIITKVSDSTPVDNIVTFSNDFVFTGAITASPLMS